ncbi:MAG: tRNA (adenosine(37)-N6)-threonylcarbamoyltransferase complex ATPase subunit type 1 TsaE [Candidatus Accumulibacter sp.]|jgi:tRNA threonylcarbamoyladenosine biosynthesis protein TsaE|nr:tRNA (adenosine(37)-N6)-threonylcarbamoyltransferase complex ATPase subunit type 1 TsaE [Accumulibacter sp.]
MSEMNDVASASFFLRNEASTLAFGRALAPFLTPGTVVWLRGNLGAGKTTVARAILRALGITGAVKSPTYTLVEVYVVSSLYLYHLDLYRFNAPEEFEDAGLGEYFRKDAVCLVEWPEKAAGYLPSADVELFLRFAGESREAQLSIRGERERECLIALKAFKSTAVR